MSKGGAAVVVALGVGLLLTHSSVKARAPSTPKPCPAPPPDQIAAVLDVWEKHGWPRREADIAIQLESGWCAQAVNPKSHAVGLIQFLPEILPTVGWQQGWAAFWPLSAAEQIPYIDAYLSHIGKAWLIPGDTYLVLVAPAFIGAPDETTIYPAGSTTAIANPSLQGPDHGITALSVRARVQMYL